MIVETNTQGFQENHETEAPSLTTPLMSQMMDHMMKTMKSEMAKMFQSIMSHR